MNDDKRMRVKELFMDSDTLMTLSDKAGALVDYGLADSTDEALAMLEDMGEVDDVDRRLKDLSATYDRLTAHRQRAIAYYDDCPDGDPRKAEAWNRLGEIGAAVVNVEDKIDELFQAHPHLSTGGA